MQFFSRSCRSVLRVLSLYLTVTISSRSCGSALRVLRLHVKVNAAATPRAGRANHATTSKDHFASNKLARRHARALRHARSPQRVHRALRAYRSEIVKSPPFFNLDHTNLRRGSRAQIRNGFFNLDHADLRRGLIFVECCRAYPVALRREERNLKLS